MPGAGFLTGKMQQYSRISSQAVWFFGKYVLLPVAQTNKPDNP
jgi:hypothetical protein